VVRERRWLQRGGEVGRKEEADDEVERGGRCIAQRIPHGVKPFYPTTIWI
jgi:hypothetical protein